MGRCDHPIALFRAGTLIHECSDALDVELIGVSCAQDSTLSLHATSKAGLLGFYNPCSRAEDEAQTASGSSARKPQLYVRYAFDGSVFEATFEDDQVVQLPSRHAHLMGPTGVVY